MLLEEDCTIPFITRYRKERTGGLDEVQIMNIKESYENYLEREKRRTYILETIEKMEKLTPELKINILKATTLNELEDIYAPYKAKKKTKGQLAIENGLEELSKLIESSSLTLSEIEIQFKDKFLNEKIKTFDEAIISASDIIIEKYAHNSDIKKNLRDMYWSDAIIQTSKRKNAETIKDFEKFRDYFEYTEKISSLKEPKAGHRFLALRRAMSLKILKVDIIFDDEKALNTIKNQFIDENKNLGMVEVLIKCAKKAYTNYIHPSLDLEIKTELKQSSDESAIDTFKINLKNLLLQPYLGAKVVLGVDPGVRTGCKIALVANTGEYIADTVIYPHPPKNDKRGSTDIIKAIIKQADILHIAIGNGTYGRETLEFLESAIPEIKSGKIKATLISEAGASIYSASAIARKEFPDKDPTVRGAISIARRFQDPLAELVKIDPKSIGVGQYQHDVSQSKLKKSLGWVVESCVNFVGVDLNTASAPLLSHISGIGPSVAENIVKHRSKIGGFNNRSELLDVSRFSKKVFEQSAGFLRIYNGKNELDSTFIHPESYPILEKWAKKNGLKDVKENINQLAKDSSLKENLGEFTFNDIVKALKAPSQDPRTEFKSTDFRKDISEIKDLTPGQWYPGIVTNITQFGAFVDIGIKENGLLHISQMADKFVDDPHQVYKVGQEVKVKILEIDMSRKRISLSCKTDSDVNHDKTTSSKGNSSKKSSPKGPKQDEFKNNPFASLQGLKL